MSDMLEMLTDMCGNLPTLPTLISLFRGFSKGVTDGALVLQAALGAH